MAVASQLLEGTAALINLADLRAAAKDRLGPDVWAYLEAGADDGLSTRNAAEAWQGIALHPHILQGVSEVDVSTQLLGRPMHLPILTAPNGRATRYHDDGELAVVNGAHAAGSIALLPSSVATSLPGLRAASPQGRFWQQLYMSRDRAWMRDTLETVAAAGAEAVVLTVDLLPDGRSAPPLPPRAFWEGPSSSMQAGIFSAASFDDLGWLTNVAEMPVLVKGVLRADDAVHCVEAGAAGLIVSNHGGNQLDTAVTVVEALPHIAAAVDGRAEILVDGGIRRGTSILKALALGAKAVLVGRPTSYALACQGSGGVAAMLHAFESELRRAMMLCGVRRLAEIGPSLISGRPHTS